MEMTHCPDLDRLTTLEQAAGWDLSDLVLHVSTCADCQASLRDLETLRGELSAVADVRTGFTEEVMRAVGESGANSVPELAGAESGLPSTKSLRSRRYPWRYPSPADLVNIGLAGLTAAFAIAIASSGGPASTSAASVLAGGLVAAAFYALADVFADSR
jgi:hypothetical protein